MKHLFYLVLGVFIVILTSATTISVMTVKPATPKATIIVGGWTTSELNENIKPWIKKGYVAKDLTAGDGGRFVILEKY